MKWKEIKEKNPKAFSLLESWGNHPAVLSRQKKRLLYDFFDENEICIEVFLGIEGHWLYKIRLNPKVFVINSEKIYDSRTETEQAAFEKAFEILEQKL